MKKIRQRAVWVALAVFAIALPIAYIMLVKPQGSKAAPWFDQSYRYRTAYSFTATSAVADERKVKVDVDTATLISAGKLQSDCDDIRFTDAGGKLLEYFIDTNTADCNNASSDFYLKVPSVATGGNLLYMYYGNAQVARTDLGGRKNDFFDDAGFSAGLKGYWNLNETTANTCSNPSTADSCDAGVNNDGTWTNSATYTASGKLNGGVTLGNGDYVTTKDIAALDSATNFTIAAWMKRSASNTNVIVAKATNSTNNTYLSMELWSDGNAYFEINANYGAVSAPDTNWHHVVMVYDGSQGSNATKVVGYVDGVQKTLGFIGTMPSSTSNYTGNFELGRINLSGGDSVSSGTIDDVRIYGRSLSSTEISRIYNSGQGQELRTPVTFTPSSGPTAASEETSPGPVNYWKFDEGQGQILNDTTYNRNAGTLGANSSSASDDPVWKDEASCVSGKCLEFDGTNDTGNLGAVKIPTTGSVSLWWKTTESTTIADHPILVARASNSQLFDIYNLAGTLYAGWYNSADKRVSWAMSGITQGQWVNIQLTWTNGGATTLYINGVQKGTPTTGLNTTWDTSTTTLRAGHATTTPGGATFGKSMIDEIKIYPYARSAAEVKAEFTSAAAVLGAADQKDYLSDGLVANWRMDEATWSGTLAEVVDSSGNGYHGQAQGATNGRAYPGAGKFGNGMVGDGVDNFVKIPNIIANPTGNITIATWAYVNALPPSGVTTSFWSWHAGTGDALDLFLSSTGNINTAGCAGSSGAFGLGSFTTTTISAGQWYHLAVTFDSVGGGRIYVNGEPIGDYTKKNQGALCGVGNTITQFDLGNWNNSGVDSELDGKEDDFRIYSRALSADEVRNLYNWAPGPVVSFNFDEGQGQTPVDGINSGVTATLGANSSVGTDDPTWTQAKVGTGLSFDGTNDTVTLTNSSLLSPGTGNMTISAWVYAGGSGERLVYTDYGANTNNLVYFGFFNSTFYAAFNDSSGNQVAASTTLSNGTWYHVEGIKNGTSAYLYVNGVLRSTATNASLGTITVSDGGTPAIGSQAGSTFWNGKIDDFKVYNYARTAGQVMEDMNGGHPLGGSPVGSQLAYWSFDEQQGQTAKDRLGYYDGTLGATASVGADDPTWKTQTDCKVNGCMNFDGVSDQVLVPRNTNLEPASTVTVTAWVKGSSPGTFKHFVTKNYNSGTGSYAFYTGASGGLEFYILKQVGSPTSSPTQSAAAIWNNQWHHVAGTYDGAKVRLYVDGKEVGSGTAATGDMIYSYNNLFLGSFDGSSSFSFPGFIDEVKIYGSALTVDQIRVDMNAGAAVNMGTTGASESAQLADGPGNPPVFEMPFNEGNGQSVSDISGNSNAGTRGASSSVASDDPTWDFVTGQPTTGNGIGGSMLRFDGSDDYVSIPDNSALNIGTADFTVEAWVKGNSMANSDIIFGKSNGGGASSSYGYLFGVFDSLYPTLYFATSGTHAKIQGTTALSNNQWYHIAIAVDRDTDANTKVYLNGQPITTTVTSASSNTGSITNTVAMAIGSESDAGFNWDGWIEDPKIYTYARTAAQVAYDYNRGAPIAWWKLDECQGSTTFDASGYGSHGAITIGGSGTQTSVGTCTTSSTAWGNGASGKYSSSLRFDGTDDTVTIADKDALDLTGNFTISFWAKYAGSGTYSAILSKKTTSLAQSDGWLIYVATSLGGIIDFLGNGSATFERINKTLDTNWHFYTFVMSSGSMTIYYDSVPQTPTSFNYSSGSLAAGTDSVKMGVRDTANLGYTNGQMDDVRIYNYAMSAAQIKKLMNEGSAVRYGQ